MDPLSSEQTAAYLAYIGVSRPRAADLASLQLLIEAHIERITFENVDVLLYRPIELDADSLFSKMIERGRGGYCFELNSLFARLLEALGYRFRLRMARVRRGVAPDTPLTVKQHLVLIVELPEGEYLVDVGFGLANPYLPLRMDQSAASADNPYVLRPLEGSHYWRPGTLELCVRGREDWVPLYRLEMEDHYWFDTKVFNWYMSTHRDSVMQRLLMVGRSDGDTRLTLFNGSFRRRARHAGYDAVEKREITDADELLSVLQNEFRLRLCPEKDVQPLRARLGSLLQGSCSK
ncbi:arylamine N-acetyltransferase-like [Amblyomma americanum]|uniref:arylamine N-acetyltransferase n=1 Tax=Amblyomma americanum TaxID=6943 RepID=A0AAQ4D7A7_AMBAM